MKKTLPILCVLMAVLTIVIAMTTVSYSWFEPDVKEGIGLQYTDEAKLRDENCEILTYSGAYNNTPGSTGYGLVQYSGQVGTGNVTVSTGQTVYYKTVIKNNSEKHDTVVSLFLPTFTVNSGTGSIGVAMPTNSFRTFSSTQTDIHIIRNANVKMFVDTDANPGEISVEWFVRCETGSVTFNPSKAFLMYS